MSTSNEVLLDQLNYSTKDTAKILAVSRQSVIRHIRLKHIRVVRFGARILVPREEILRVATEGVGTYNPAEVSSEEMSRRSYQRKIFNNKNSKGARAAAK